MSIARRLCDFGRIAATPVLLLAALVLGLLWSLASAAGAFGIFLELALAAATVFYPYLIVIAVAAGREPPVLEAAQFNLAADVALLAHAGLLVAALAVVAIQPSLRVPGGVLLAVIAPAAIAIMAHTRALERALNPLAWWQLARALGPAYILPVALALATLAFSMSGVASQLPVLGSVLMVYALFVAAAATGLALQWRAEALDLPLITRAERRALWLRRDEQRHWDALLAEVHAHLTRGNTERGYATLRGALERERNAPAAWSYVYATLDDWQLPVHQASFARRYIEKLITDEQWQAALEVAQRQLRRDSGFRPFAAHCDVLADYADSVGQGATAGLLRTPAGANREHGR